MKFFFSDSNDAVDPGFDFKCESPRTDRLRSAEDKFAHDLFDIPPYDGILVSRAALDNNLGNCRFTQTQRMNALMKGLHSVYHLTKTDFSYKRTGKILPLMGDCGSFTYIKKGIPPYGVSDTISFYQDYGFDFGISPDHIISEYNISWDDSRIRPCEVTSRAEYTQTMAIDFFTESQRRRVNFEPIGVVQSWSPNSATKYTKRLIETGYTYIALGGLAYRPTIDIYNTLCEIFSAIPSYIKIHILGFNRNDSISMFKGMPIYSFDSCSPLMRAIKDDKDNYYSPKGEHYTSIRLPSPEETKIQKRIWQGELNDKDAKEIDAKTMNCLHMFEKGKLSLEKVLQQLNKHSLYFFKKQLNESLYRRLLTEKPWEKCPCSMCKSLGIDILLFRGINRNKRRGYHNLFVFYNHLQEIIKMETLEVPCIKVEQSPNCFIYIFTVNGKELSKFCTVSRVSRKESGELLGYQRPEIQEHINEIRSYLEKENAMLPNSITVAFTGGINFSPLKTFDKCSTLGILHIQLSRSEKALIVDGQQRTAALRTMRRTSFPVPVVAFEALNQNMEREQFILINNTKPLPKSLVYELLPSIGSAVPAQLKKRQFAYSVMDDMSSKQESPFFQRIKRATTGINPTANIKDISVLKMIEHSFSGGILQNRQNKLKESISILNAFWNAVRDVFPDAWNKDPKTSRLTHGVGIVSMGFLMDAIGYVLESQNKTLSMNNFRQEILRIGENTPWTSGEWVFSKEYTLPWNELQNTSRHIDLLSNYLIRKYKQSLQK